MAKITLHVPDYYDLNKIEKRVITTDGYITKLLTLYEVDNDGKPVFVSPVFEHFVNKTFGVEPTRLGLDDSGNWCVEDRGSLGEFERDL